MIDAQLLRDLRCPETHQTLTAATASLVEQLNQKYQAGQLRDRRGHTVGERLDGGLLRADGKFVYPIRHDIPIMLVDEAIPLPG